MPTCSSIHYMYFSVTDKLLFVTAVTIFYRQLTDMACLSSQYSSNFTIRLLHFFAIIFFIFYFCIFLFCFYIFFIFIPINLYKRPLARVFLNFYIYYLVYLFRSERDTWSHDRDSFSRHFQKQNGGWNFKRWQQERPLQLQRVSSYLVDWYSGPGCSKSG